MYIEQKERLINPEWISNWFCY